MINDTGVIVTDTMDIKKKKQRNFMYSSITTNLNNNWNRPIILKAKIIQTQIKNYNLNMPIPIKEIKPINLLKK